MPHRKIWVDLLINPKQGKVFSELRGELINTGIDYDENIDRENTSDRIAGVVSEEES